MEDLLLQPNRTKKLSWLGFSFFRRDCVKKLSSKFLTAKNGKLGFALLKVTILEFSMDEEKRNIVKVRDDKNPIDYFLNSATLQFEIVGNETQMFLQFLVLVVWKIYV